MMMMLGVVVVVARKLMMLKAWVRARARTSWLALAVPVA